jgi:hypothetical protein
LAHLYDPRVWRFIEATLAASPDSALTLTTLEGTKSLDNDLQYRLDLGIVKKDGRPRPANPIFTSVSVIVFNQ